MSFMLKTWATATATTKTKDFNQKIV